MRSGEGMHTGVWGGGTEGDESNGGEGRTASLVDGESILADGRRKGQLSMRFVEVKPTEKGMRSLKGLGGRDQIFWTRNLKSKGCFD